MCRAEASFPRDTFNDVHRFGKASAQTSTKQAGNPERQSRFFERHHG
jgi:hypothetical protein